VQIDFEKLGISRKDFMERMLELGVGSQVLYIPVHTQPWYKKTYGYAWGDYPIAEAYYEKALSLPLFPKMTDAEIKKVIEVINEIVFYSQ
jgi:dTDP-4-amino-4,6-dideoxygalactose transaminase